MKKAFGNKLFLTGFSFTSGLLLMSVLYFLIFQDKIPTSSLLLDNNEKPIQPPYSWKVYPPMGTDNFGRNLAIVMLIGVKYTILAAAVITILRVLPSIFIGFIIHFYLRKIERPIKYIADSINYFPTTLLVFFLLGWFGTETLGSYGESPLSFWELIFFYIFILTIVSIPAISVLIANEARLINQMDFIECSRILGASSRRIIVKHILPTLTPQLFIIYIREFIQTLILMAHLGVLGIFMGGYFVKRDLFDVARVVSNSSEWAGALGMWWNFLWTSYPWISLVPIALLTLLIIAAKCMLDGLQAVLSSEEQVVKVPEQEAVGQMDKLEPFQLLKAKS
ncbi:ABC transporter permease [Psychrobacillus sp.]|uniref:ABC transporter permease n=1 Tax=Psychrobacillus sp. TaxID=1871623 RepID=UPI0037C5E7A5